MRTVIIAAIAVLSLSGCSLFELRVVRKDYIAPAKEYVDCRGSYPCSGDGFIETMTPECWQLSFNDLGGEINSCVPKKVWERTEAGEIWHSNSMEEKSR